MPNKEFDTFLFQTGAIRSLVAAAGMGNFAKFLFQTGAIRSEQAVEEATETDTEFLFQTGAIRSLDVEVNVDGFQCFYSKLVRLEVDMS